MIIHQRDKYRSMTWYLLIVTGIFEYVQSELKPVPDTFGTSFLFSIPHCLEENPPSMYIVSQSSQDIHINMTSYEMSQMTVLAGSALRQAIKCPDNSMNLTTSKAYRLTSTGEVSLYIELTMDTYVVYPEDTLSTKYQVVTMLTGVFDSTFLSVTGNYTILSFDLPSSLQTAIELNETVYNPGAKFNIYLQEDETLQVRCSCDMTGIKIASSLPVAVLVGAQNSSNTALCVVQQLLPEFAWGRRYIFSRHKWMSEEISLKIVAKQKNTDISIILKDETISATLTDQLKLSMQILVSEFIAIEAHKSVLCFVMFKTVDPSINAHYSMLSLSPMLLNHVRGSFQSLDSSEMSVNFILSSDSFSLVSFNESSDLLPFTRPMTFFWNYFLCHNIKTKFPHNIRIADSNTAPTFAIAFTRNGSFVRAYPFGTRITPIYDACVKSVKAHGGNGDGIDNDCDNSIDEEKLNNKDDDNDGLIDEDIVYRGVIRPKPVDMAWVYYQKVRAENQETGLAASVVSILISIGVGLSGVFCFIGFMFLVDKLKQKWSGSTRVGPIG